MLNLFDYQEDVLQKLREAIQQGHKAIVLVAPTGAGKTEMAMSLLDATSKKGNKAAMLLDRIVLCDQTSQRLSKYNIAHGVMQSGHWRYRPYERIQVCSAQTIERRGSFPDLRLLVIDECHQTRKQTVEFIKSNPDVMVIGLTATPFTKGLGKIYSTVVSSITTEDLVSRGRLAPLKVFISKEIDMTGAKKVAGEWSVEAVEERGMKITGDIVSEWVQKTHEVFGGPKKTVVFCAGVAHGADLAQKFAEAGYNFVALSYKDDDQFKKDAIEEFAKPDSSIHGLIATDILTKGFDVPDVMIGVSARPFSKSLSSHIQQMGRVMRSHPSKEFALWLCLAKGSLVLTDSGLVPIDKVSLDHKIWDGTNFVSHGGAVCNGTQKVITYQGLTATKGHLVHTTKGWRTFGDCASEQIKITQTGFGGVAVRIGGDLRSACFLVGREAKNAHARFVRVCGLWVSQLGFPLKSAGWSNNGLPSMQPAGCFVPNVALQQGAGNEGKVSIQVMQPISSLRRSWGGVQVLWSKAGNYLDHGKSWCSKVFIGSRAIKDSAGSNRSKWSLRSWKSSLAISGIESAEQAREPVRGPHAQVQAGSPRNSLFRQYIEAFLLGWNDGGRGVVSIPTTLVETEREVWDILDAGPHNRFTCEGLLVHNCHSGNYLRFREDWDDVYENGVSKLDEGKEKAKSEPTDQEKKDAKCPRCNHLWPSGSDTCPSCGFVRERKSQIVAVPGVMEELEIGADKAKKQLWYSSLLHVAGQKGYSDGWVSHKMKEKFGVWPRGLAPIKTEPTLEVKNWIRSRQIAYAKGRAKGVSIGVR